MKISPEKPLETWWKSYKNNFFLPDGRVQRPEHEYDTVSEGQAYAMIFAVFMNDKNAFDLIFRWTEEHLSRGSNHGDLLLAWHWKDDGVKDWMSASDADCDYAFALLLASHRWKERAYREKAIQVISDIMRLETVRGVDNRLFLLPGLWGRENNGCIIQNPSYYSPAAFRLFYETTQDNQWLQVIETGYWLFSQAGIRLDTINACGLIPDWCIVDAQGNILKAEGRSTDYGWDAVRMPLRIGLDILWNYDAQEGASRRIGEMCAEMFGYAVSEATLQSARQEQYAALEPFERRLVEILPQEPVLHADETSVLIDKVRHWLHVLCTPLLTFFAIHLSRGKDAIEAAGIIPRFTGWLMHDFLSSYLGFENCLHTFCKSHLLRELVFLFELHRQAWADDLHDLFLDMHLDVQHRKARDAPVTEKEYQRWCDQYWKLLRAGRKANPLTPEQQSNPSTKQSKEQNLLDRL